MIEEKKLKPCPFCGSEAECERVGTNRQSCIVSCTNCHCSLESNEIGYGYFWNFRTPAVPVDWLLEWIDEQMKTVPPNKSDGFAGAWIMLDGLKAAIKGRSGA